MLTTVAAAPALRRTSMRPAPHFQATDMPAHARNLPLAASLSLWLLSALGSPAAHAAGPQMGGCPVFPAAAIFNTPIDDVQRFPVHAQSAAWRTLVRADGGVNLHLHLDMGQSEDPQQVDTYWGIPTNLVDGTPGSTQWLPFSFKSTDPNDKSAGWPDESDCAVPLADSSGYRIRQGCTGKQPRYFPFPLDAAMKIEGGVCHMEQGQGCDYNDRHLLVLESGQCRLWESYYAYKGRQGWHLSGVAAWNLKRMDMRPDGWTSADAAGLPILPLLLKADEADSGVIRHALRMTLRNGVMTHHYLWPASHQAGLSNEANIPFGALLRLRADFVIPDSWTTQARAIAQAMKTYGVYVADNGSDFFVQGEPNAHWKGATVSQLQGGLTLDRFDFVDLGTITQDPRFVPTSYRAQW
jgi:hypothetical protein